MKICPKCGRKYDFIERRTVGRKIYVYAVHCENSKKRRCLITKKLRQEILEAELTALLEEAKKDRETLLHTIKVILEFLSSIT